MNFSQDSQDRVGEVWLHGVSPFVGLIVASFVSDGRGYGESAGRWVHRMVDLVGAADFPSSSSSVVEERVLSDGPGSGWRRP